MRLRILLAAATAVLAVLALAGCSSSNVGQAAEVNGQRISESDVNGYVTPRAQPVSVSDQSGTSTINVAPRAFVVEILIYNQLLRDLLAKTPGGAPTKGELAQLSETVRAGKSAKQVANQQGVKGFTSAFNDEIVRRLAYGQALQQEQQKGADITKLARDLDLAVSISPRYGRWDRKTLSVDVRPDAGVPSFVTLQPTPVALPTQ